MAEAARDGERTFRGIPVSAGVCRGKILVIRRNRPAVTKRTLPEAGIPEEINRLERAISETRTQIQAVQDKVIAAMGAKEASIFDAHLLVLEDRTLLDEVVRAIQHDKVNAEHAFHGVAERYAATLAETERAAFRFLHVSTDEVYGSLGATGLFSEETPYAPNSPYAASKASADHLVRAYHETYQLPAIITNCSNNYGPYQFPE